MRLALLALLSAAVVAVAGCGRGADAPRREDLPSPPFFQEVARGVGIDFLHVSGARGEFLMPEIMGGGGGFLDFDGDGDLDVYLVQSGRIGQPDPSRGNRLYRNEGHERFSDVTVAAGVGDTGYGMGCAAGDYDNDGDVDLYVTNLGANVLYRNEGDGTFRDVTSVAGVGDPAWSTSAAFVDYDADGDLDLFVTNYVEWSNSAAFTKKKCFVGTGARDYCSPQAYAAPSPDKLYRNEGDGTFLDISREAGIRDAAGTGLGVVCTDLDGDGKTDFYVSNDQMPSFAWIQTGPDRFRERAMRLGVAVDESGRPQAGMGVALADVDDDGRLDLWKVHLDRESHILYRGRAGYFDDVTAAWGLSAITRRHTGFGTALADFDLDGLVDVFVANGRVEVATDATPTGDPYAEPDQLLRQSERGQFVEVENALSPDLPPATSRGAAFGDYDDDGDVDVLVVNRDGPVRLLRNDGKRQGGFLTLRLVERHGRDAYGARVTVIADGQRRVFPVLAAYSYCSTNDPRLHVGLGRLREVERVEVRWPDGEESTYGPFAADRAYELRQGANAAAVAAPRSRGNALSPQREPKRPEFEAIARSLAEGRNEFFGHTQITELVGRLAGENLVPAERIRLEGLLAVERLRVGEIDRAAEIIESALAHALSDPATSGLAAGLHRIRGLVYLRQAEIENCVRRHNADCCIFPLAGGGVHGQPESARKALESYRICAAAHPQDLKLRWLLNLVSMALGEHPEGVAPADLIPPEVFASEADIGRFPDIAPALGVDTFNLCGGALVDDFDLDGFLDILTTTSDPSGPVTLYRSRGDGTFEDRSGPSRLDDQLGGLSVLGADYDNDGDLDVLILRGAWLYDEGRIRNSLLRNEGDGTFTDVTREAGVAEPAAPTQTAAWGDFDNDGDLDLYVANESRIERGEAQGDYPAQLFRNAGDGTFTDVAREAGVTNDRYAKGLAAGDYDNDGDLDLYVSNIGKNRLYRNEGGGKFVDVAEAAGVTEPSGRSFATWFFDHDNDGWLDLFVAAYDADVEDVAADYLGLPQNAHSPKLYRNDRDGTFTDVAKRLGLDHAWLPMGANFGDLDHDGWLDIYLATGDPDFQTLMPNVMLRNDRGLRFQDVTTSGGFGHLQKGHGVAFADLDNDGDQDLYHQLGGFYPGDRFANALFRNPGHGNHFVVITLLGSRSNRAGVGARLAVTFDTPQGPRTVHRAAGSISSFGGSPLRQEIGLADATRIVEVVVDWPASGTKQIVRDVPLDGAVRIREGANGFEALPFRKFRFKAP